MCGQHRIAVVGGGSWATALVSVLINNVKEGNKVNWYLRKKEHIDYAQKHGQNPKYLNSLIFDTTKIEFFNDINDVVANSDIVIFAVPSAFIQSTMQQFTGTLENHIVVSAIKGMIPDQNILMADYFHQTYNVDLEKNFCVLAGAGLAGEGGSERVFFLSPSI